MGRQEALQESQRLALWLRLVGPLCFTLSTFGTKRARAAGLGTGQATLLRSVLNLLVTLAALLVPVARAHAAAAWRGGPRGALARRSSSSAVARIKTRSPALLLLRGAFGCAAILCYTEALATLPTANALILSRVHPLIGGLLSAALLGEPFAAQQMAPIVAGLCGVALVAQPSPEAPLLGSALALAAAVFTAAAFTAVRALQRRGENTLLIMLSFNGMGALGSAALLAWRLAGSGGNGGAGGDAAAAAAEAAAGAAAGGGGWGQWLSHAMDATGLRAGNEEALGWVLWAAATMQVAQHCMTKLLALQPTAQSSTSSFLIAAWGVAIAALTGESVPSQRALAGCFLICAPQCVQWRASDIGGHSDTDDDDCAHADAAAAQRGGAAMKVKQT